MRAIDLNCDLGESFGVYTLGADSQVMDFITSANVACGWHGGDPVVLEQTVATARAKGVRVGAHPGYPDLMGFGRREMRLAAGEAYAGTLYQMGALEAFCRVHRVTLQHMKPHGALYNMACREDALALEVCRASRDFDSGIAVLAPFGSALHRAALALGLPFAGEFFADRAYNPDGSLVARGLPGAMVHDPDQAAARVLEMIERGTVTCLDGTVIEMACVSVCVHGDNARAVETVAALRRTLETAGVAIRPLAELI